MSCKTVSKCFFVLMIIGLFVPDVTQAAPPQEDSVEEMILRMGPDPTLFDPQAIKLTFEGWKFQSELNQRQQDLIEQSISQLTTELNATQKEKDALRAKLNAAGLPFPVDGQLVQNIEDGIRMGKSEINGYEAELQKMKLESKAVKESLLFQRETKAEEVDLLNQKMQMVASELQQVEKMFKKNVTTKRDIQATQVKLVEVKNQLTRAERELQQISSRMAQDLSSMIETVESRMQNAMTRLAKLESQRQQIQHLDPVRRIEMENIKTKQTQRLIEMARTRQFELQLDNTRNQALIELTEKRMEKFRGSQASDEKADRKNDN